MKMTIERLKVAGLSNKKRFDKIHRLRMKKIEKDDWILVFDSIFNHQHNIVRKFARRWFGLYEVERINDNDIYLLCELAGTMLRILVAGKYIKVF